MSMENYVISSVDHKNEVRFRIDLVLPRTTTNYLVCCTCLLSPLWGCEMRIGESLSADIATFHMIQYNII